MPNDLAAHGSNDALRSTFRRCQSSGVVAAINSVSGPSIARRSGKPPAGS